MRSLKTNVAYSIYPDIDAYMKVLDYRNGLNPCKMIGRTLMDLVEQNSRVAHDAGLTLLGTVTALEAHGSSNTMS